MTPVDDELRGWDKKSLQQLSRFAGRGYNPPFADSDPADLLEDYSELQHLCSALIRGLRNQKTQRPNAAKTHPPTRSYRPLNAWLNGLTDDPWGRFLTTLRNFLQGRRLNLPFPPKLIQRPGSIIDPVDIVQASLPTAIPEYLHLGTQLSMLLPPGPPRPIFNEVPPLALGPFL
jgi:hypothetical protein